MVAAKPASAQVEISGHVDLHAAHGQQVASGEQADTLVYFVPGNGASHVKPGHFTVYTHNRDFSPEAIAIPQGSTVTFVNLDDVRHNVFSVTPGSSFDLGYQGAGEKASHSFTRAGLVLISCNVHHSMELDMLVVPSGYVAKVAANGTFSMRGLPAGPGMLHFWNPRALPASQAISLPASGTVIKQVLQVIKPRMSTELNAGPSP
ncbi:MAG: plastocyanin/azurin family copper-binding protein [Rhodanobacter sp.]